MQISLSTKPLTLNLIHASACHQIPIILETVQSKKLAILDLRGCSQESINVIKANCGQWLEVLVSVGVQRIGFREDSASSANIPSFPVKIVDMESGNNMESTKLEINGLLNAIKRNPDDHVVMVSMITNSIIATPSTFTPYQNVDIADIIRSNHKGHDPDELLRYTTKLMDTNQWKLDIYQIDLARPHLKSFTYEALWLKDLSQRMEICVDAWCGLFNGEPVRIARHVRPVTFIER